MFIKTLLSFVALSFLGSPAFNCSPSFARETTAQETPSFASNKQSKSIQKGPKQTVDEVWQIVNHQYVDGNFNGVDWKQIRQDYVLDSSYSSSKEAYQAIAKMLDLLDDPFTRFMTPEEFAAIKTSAGEGNANSGLNIIKNRQTGKIEVVSAVPDSPAFAAGINYGDVITKIGNRNLQEMGLSEVSTLLRGKSGTQVNLTIERNGQDLNFNLTRKIIEVNPVELQIEEIEPGKIAYLQLNNFNSNAERDLQQAIKQAEAQNVAGYVLDLRGNRGGLLYSAIDIARMWLNEGTIVTTIDRQGIGDDERAKNNALTDKPLVVLVDKATASASEIVAAALKENQRATIIGEQTYGLGLVQSIRSLRDDSGLAITFAKFETPLGNEIEDVGVAPDLKVQLTEAEKASFQRNPQSLATQKDLMWTEAIEVLQKQCLPL